MKVTQKFTTVPVIGGAVYPGGYDARYRVWTAANGLDFDALPDPQHDGPATVTINGWSFSTHRTCGVYSSPSVVAADDGMHTVHITRVTAQTTEKHPLDGRKYTTRRDAQRDAYAAGVLGFMVYERHAEQYGLPTGQWHNVRINGADGVLAEFALPAEGALAVDVDGAEYVGVRMPLDVEDDPDGISEHPQVVMWPDGTGEDSVTYTPLGVPVITFTP